MVVGEGNGISAAEMRRRTAIGLMLATAFSLLLGGSADAAFSISTYQPKKTRVTSQGAIYVDVVDCSGCSRPVTIKRANSGALFGKTAP